MKHDQFLSRLRAQTLAGCAFALLCLPATLEAATIFVLNTSDTGPGSLRQAIDGANSSAGPDRIEFNIPGPGPFTISVHSQLPLITDAVVIDGTTQPGFSGTPIVELSGAEAGQNVSGILLFAGNCTVQGLVINSFSNGSGIEVHAGNNTIQGNYIGLDRTGTRALGNTYDGILVQSGTGTLIGGLTPAARNVISGNGLSGIEFQSGTSGNRVQGNYVGTDVFGANAVGNANPGVYVSFSSGNTIGGTSAEARNLISGNSYGGVYIDGARSTANTVVGNFIGIDGQGQRAIPNLVGGVVIDDGAGNNQIGGTSAGSRNVISGNAGAGVQMIGNSVGNRVQGDFIGTDADGGTPLGNGLSGVLIDSAANNFIGGTSAGAQNRIAFNGVAGVTVVSGTGNAIQRNAIFSNATLGIDLGADGVTLNDASDTDPGPNNLQNFPVLTAVTNSGTNLVIQGSLDSAPNATFGIEFFANDAPNQSGYGEGQIWLGSSTVLTGPGGNAKFTVSFPTNVSLSQFICATATDPARNTSEFSAALPVGPPVLKIARFRSGVLLSWSALFPGFQLEESSDLAGDVWSVSASWPVLANNTYTVTEGPLSGTRCYRLHKP